jgi:cobalt-zinc-cadmium efflux system outer membrane protein
VKKRMWERGCIVVLLASLGCAGSDPEPLNPQKNEADFRARSLQDPGLARFMKENPEARAAVFPPARWDLRSLTFVAFYFHPDLDLARARLAQAQAGRVTAGQWPNPVAAFDLSKVTNVEPGIKPWVYGVNLSVPIDTLWKRGYRIEEADRGIEGAQLQLAETGWRVRSRVRGALSDHLFFLRELELRKEEEAARSRTVVALERKLALGDIFRLDVDAAQGELHAARVSIHTAEGKVAESRMVLASALGLPGTALRGVPFEWPELETPPDEEGLSIKTALLPGLLNRLDLQALLAEYASALTALKREWASRYPDISLGPGYTYDQGQRKLNLGLSMTLPIFNQNEGPIAEAEARRKEIAARFAVLQSGVMGELETALERYRAAQAELAESRKTLDLLARREASLRRAVELGDLDPTALLGLRLERVQAEESRLGSLRHAEEALGALEDALERPLGSRSGSPAPEPETPRGGD